MVYVVMGVCGCGKTSVGELLAQKLALAFYDGDDFHPATNKNKMSSGIPLTDEDREPWLRQLRQHISLWEKQGGAVLACSALKQSYRDILTGEPSLPAPYFIYLRISPQEVARRLQQRKDHFFPKELLASQFAVIEEPAQALWVTTDRRNNEEIVSEIVHNLALSLPL